MFAILTLTLMTFFHQVSFFIIIFNEFPCIGEPTDDRIDKIQPHYSGITLNAPSQGKDMHLHVNYACECPV